MSAFRTCRNLFLIWHHVLCCSNIYYKASFGDVYKLVHELKLNAKIEQKDRSGYSRWYGWLFITE